MTKAHIQKAEQVSSIKEKISNSKSIVLVNYKGITVSQDTELRKQFREANVDYRVLKNRLVKRAFNDLGITDFDSALEGTTAIAFSNGDEMQGIKIVVDAAKKIPVLETKCGMFEGKYVNNDEIIIISSIPSKEVLLAQLCGLLQSGLSGLARAISQIADQKAE